MCRCECEPILEDNSVATIRIPDAGAKELEGNFGLSLLLGRRAVLLALHREVELELRICCAVLKHLTHAGLASVYCVDIEPNSYA